MATLTFDKLAYVDRLQAAGMGEREARALAEGLDQALREEVATRTDVAAVRSDLAEVKSGLAAGIAAVRSDLTEAKSGLTADIAAVRIELKGDIAAVKTELKSDLVAVEHKLRVEMQTVKHDMLRWMVGVAFAQAGLTLALVRFLPH